MNYREAFEAVNQAILNLRGNWLSENVEIIKEYFSEGGYLYNLNDPEVKKSLEALSLFAKAAYEAKHFYDKEAGCGSSFNVIIGNINTALNKIEDYIEGDYLWAFFPNDKESEHEKFTDAYEDARINARLLRKKILMLMDLEWDVREAEDFLKDSK